MMRRAAQPFAAFLMGVTTMSAMDMQARKSKRLVYFRRNYQLYLLLIPGIFWLFVYRFLPLFGLSIAFKDFKLFSGPNIFAALVNSEWVGLDNFRRIFGSSDFAHVFGNTLTISLLKFVLLFPLPIIIAIMFNEVRQQWFKRSVQTLVYMPHFLSWVIIYGIFLSLLGSDGMVNRWINNLGYDRVSFFTDGKVFRWLLVFLEGWRESGWSAIIYLSALTAINTELYEAAKIDGASKLRQIWHVTVPGIMPTVIMMLILRLGNILNAGFEQILVMYNPMVYSTADIIDTYVYRMGIGRMDFGLGTALGLFNSVIALVFIVSSNAASRKALGRSIW